MLIDKKIPSSSARTPREGSSTIFVNEDGRLYTKQSDGTVQEVSVPPYLVNPTMVYDNATSIGLKGNLEEKETVADPTIYTTIENVKVMQPPTIVIQANKVHPDITFGAYWYNDFGMDYTRQSASAWKGWYDWRWNFKHTNGYRITTQYNASTTYSADGNTFVRYNGVLYKSRTLESGTAANVGRTPPSNPTYWVLVPEPQYWEDREPMLGWYRGDDPMVLGWQVKWLVDAGIDYVVLQQRTTLPTTHSTGTWNQPAAVNHWTYQLFTNVAGVGGNGLKLAMWLPTNGYGATGNAATPTPAGVGYSPSVAYETGNTVRTYGGAGYNIIMYTALQASTGQQPRTEGSVYWTPSPMPEDWRAYVSFYATYKDKIATVTRNGKKYAILYMHETEVLRSGIGTQTLVNWTQTLGAEMNAAVPEWDGVALLMRNSPAPRQADGVTYATGSATLNYDELEANRVYVIRGDYDSRTSTNSAVGSYQSKIDSFPSYSSEAVGRAPQRHAPCVATSVYAVPPHPSAGAATFNFPGHTPELYKKWLRKVLDWMLENNSKMLMIYNVAEWAEGGPGLQPNKQDGFGYIDATRQVFVGS